MKRKLLILITVIGWLVMGCSTAVDEEPGTPRAAEFSAGMVAVDTRADETVWSAEHQTIGISALGEEADYINQKYEAMGTTGSISFKTAAGVKKYYFDSTGSYESFAAYAPYQAGVTNKTINIQMDASTYNVPDLIMAKTGKLTYATNTAKLDFAHQMAQLQLTVQLDEAGFSKGTTVSQVKISHLVSEATFSITEGTVTAGSAVTSFTVDNSELPTYTVIPQSGIVVTVTTSDGNIYQKTLPELESGKLYALTLSVKNEYLTVSPSITGWSTDTEDVTATIIKRN